MSPRSVIAWCSQRSLPSVVAASALAVGSLIGGPLLLGMPPTHRFLLWNLALAWVPYLCALALDGADRHRLGPTMVAAGFAWLLFLPNAPYLLTDLSHLDAASPAPWLDLGRLLAFAWAGWALTIASLRIVHRIARARIGVVGGWTVVAFAAVASGAGIVLGRFSRLNSWEALTHPRAVIDQAGLLLASPRIVCVGVFFAALVFISYIGQGRESGVA